MVYTIVHDEIFSEYIIKYMSTLDQKVSWTYQTNENGKYGYLYLDGEEISLSKIKSGAEQIQLEYSFNEYKRLRKAEYQLLNQDELRYDDMVNGTTTWKSAIEKIKLKYPKPEVEND
jgi:hypothetical protein